jgi:hypothetical protein
MTAPALTYFRPDFGRAHDFPATTLFINNILALALHPVALSTSKPLPHETKRTTRAQHTNPQRVHTTTMRPNSIISISALAAGSLASGAHDVDNLLARTIDHKMMDPARLSVLSVLKTAIASGPAFPRPTGDFEPEWYQKLPEEVKHILPSLYPAAAADVSASPPMRVSVFASVTAFEPVLESHLPAPTAAPILATLTPSLRTSLAVRAILTHPD